MDSLSSLRSALDTLYDGFNVDRSANDPVWIVRRYPQPADQEIAGFVASALAFGRVQSVLNSVDRVLEVMGSSPSAYVRGFDPARERKTFSHIVHRWTNGADFAALTWLMHQMIDQHGSIEGFF